MTPCSPGRKARERDWAWRSPDGLRRFMGERSNWSAPMPVEARSWQRSRKRGARECRKLSHPRFSQARRFYSRWPHSPGVVQKIGCERRSVIDVGLEGIQISDGRADSMEMGRWPKSRGGVCSQDLIAPDSEVKKRGRKLTAPKEIFWCGEGDLFSPTGLKTRK